MVGSGHSPGRNFGFFVAERIASASCVIVLWSESSIKEEKTWVLDEASEGRERGSLIPVRIDNVKPPMGFRSLQSVDLIAWNGDVASPDFLRLRAEIAKRVGRPPAEDVAILPAATTPLSSRRGEALGGYSHPEP